MRKILIGIAAAIVVVVGTALIVPNFIDWNAYKAAFADEVKRVTGRNLAIGGDIRISLLPAPTMVVEDLHFANAEGRPDADMLRLRSAEIRLRLTPLFGGRIEFGQVRLVEPEVLVETLADGRLNWDLAFATGADRSSVAIPTPGATRQEADGAPALPPIWFEHIEVERGAIRYRDITDGTILRIDDLTAVLQSRALNGPFESKGSLRYQGAPLTFDLAVGEVRGDDPIALRVSLSDGTDTRQGEISGSLSGINDAPSFRGRLRAEGENLRDALSDHAQMPAPKFLAQAFKLGGDLNATDKSITINKLSMEMGDSRATGTLSLVRDDKTRAAVDLRVNKIDLDRWLSMSEAQHRNDRPANEPPQRMPAGGEIAGAKSKSPEPIASFVLPDDLVASVRLSVDAVPFRGGVIRQLEANGDLADGTLTIGRIAALLPGATDMTLSGSATTTDRPQFEGDVTVESDDLRGVLRWLAVDIDGLPPGRLRSLSLTTALSASMTRIEARDLALTLDGSNIVGGVVWDAGGIPPLSADFTVDRLDADGLIPTAAKPNAGLRGDKGVRVPPSDANSKRPSSSLPPESVGGGLDAELRLRVNSLAFQGVRAANVVLDGTLRKDELQLRRLSVGDIAGASGWVSGVVSGLSDTITFEDMNFEIDVPEPARLLPVFTLNVPKAARKIGTLTSYGRIAGTADKATLDVTLMTAGAEINASGALTMTSDNPAFSGKAGLRHPDLSVLLRALGVDYLPAQETGKTDIAARVTAGRDNLTLDDLDGVLAGVSVKGSLAMDLSTPRPAITTDLTTGIIALDRLLPGSRRKAEAWRLLPASWTATARPTARTRLGVVPASVHARWSRTPFRLDGLTDVDAAARLRSKAIQYDTLELENADLTLTLAQGVLVVEKFTGQLFGGAFNASGRLMAAESSTGPMAPTSTAVPTIQLKADLAGADLHRFSQAMDWQAITSGRGDVNVTLASRGQSMSELISGLNGNTALSFRDVEVSDNAGTSPEPLLRVLKALDQLGVLLTAGKLSKSSADVTATTRIVNGVAKSDDMRLTYFWGTGDAKGTLDLPAWTIDASGKVRAAPNVWNQLLSKLGSLKPPSAIDFTVRGPIDDADVRVNTRALSVIVPIPGVGLIDRGLGNVFDTLIPRPQN